jgi:hypothetical protein
MIIIYYRYMKYILVALLIIVISTLFGVGTVYLTTPTSLAFPKKDHYHFRAQVIINNQVVDFSESKFQAPLVQGLCDGTLSKEPFHFHDGEKQTVHVHWQGVTGGQWLKYYGLNLIDTSNASLGIRLDKLFSWPVSYETIPVFNTNLSSNIKTLWVYKGDESGFNKVNTTDFLTKDLNEVFGKYSEGRKLQSKNSVQTAFAHNGIDDGDGDPNAIRENVVNPKINKELTKGQLEKLNDLVGNIVIFVQNEEPKQEQIKEKFNNLEPLKDSVCGG